MQPPASITCLRVLDNILDQCREPSQVVSHRPAVMEVPVDKEEEVELVT